MPELEFQESEERASAISALFAIQEARANIHREIEAMTAEGKRPEVIEEEESVVHSFRYVLMSAE